MSVAFQTSGGPAFGQDLSSPVSVDRLSRLGPRNCGQSAAPPGADNATAMTSARQVERVFIGSGSLIRKTVFERHWRGKPFRVPHVHLNWNEAARHRRRNRKLTDRVPS